MSAYLAYLSVGAQMSGMREEANRAGSAAQLLQWVCDQKNASTEAMDENYKIAKSAFRQLKKNFPQSSHPELLEMLPSFLMDLAMQRTMEGVQRQQTAAAAAPPTVEGAMQDPPPTQ